MEVGRHCAGAVGGVFSSGVEFEVPNFGHLKRFQLPVQTNQSLHVLPSVCFNTHWTSGGCSSDK